MAEPEVVVSRHVRLEAPSGQGLALAAREGSLAVELDEGRRARLAAGGEKTPAYAQILAGLERLDQPVYLELEPDGETVSLLRIPDVGLVRPGQETDAAFEFTLNSSHARFSLNKESPGFEPFAQTLVQSARSRRPVILTADERGQVIDIRFFEPGPDDGPFPNLPFPPPLALERSALEWLRWPFWPWNSPFFGCTSQTRAQQALNAMAGRSCAPLTVPAPCIPFLYPDDGCWARAHEMCRLMIATGLTPRKIWIQGNLRTPTRNNPGCFVNWGWHVAPVLCVRRLWRGGRQTMVIDPSLFTGPVPVSQWKSVQGDPGAVLTFSEASDYLWGETDATYSKTNDRLAFYRLRLQERAANFGPPPYANCP